MKEESNGRENAQKTGRKVSWWIKRALIIAGGILVVVGSLWAVDSCYTTIDMEKLGDVSYQIVDEENIPKEIYEQLIEDMDEVCRKSYICSDKLYIVVCYGAQPTHGYSIKVDQLYESTNALIIETTLIGPSRQDKVVDEISYPYIVLKVEQTGKSVVFK